MEEIDLTLQMPESQEFTYLKNCEDTTMITKELWQRAQQATKHQQVVAVWWAKETNGISLTKSLPRQHSS